ncbi:DUF6428 family protein [Maribacter sp. LLG6340-A2]|uniref:DUF6428 family protein n=1 Tax=Maribacter sp. LLG6340-A2 TaxID=3160834 RepID=UPI003867DF67
MKLSQVKTILKNAPTIGFRLPDGKMVPNHFHVTEIGKVRKDFIDCGGTIRHEEKANFQLWDSNDYDHRLHPEKLLYIIELSEKILKIDDLEIEVEYQADTIGKFGLDFDGKTFLLTQKQTTCLAQDSCGNVIEQPNNDATKMDEPCCAPDGNCC